MAGSDHVNINTHRAASALEPTALSDFPEWLQPIVGAALDRAQKGLDEDFVGVTTDGIARAGLFSIARTDISVQPMIDAAAIFLRSLNEQQRKTVGFVISDDRAWRSWHNMHFFLMRHGLLLDGMENGQREMALALLSETLSASSYANARDVMRLNEHVRELAGREDEYGEFYYWISVFGEPSQSAPWGWQIDGHHLSINCFVLGDQIIVTPDFRGSEPIKAEFGKFVGTRVFEEEETQGLDFMKSLSVEQRAAASVGVAPPREVFTIAQADNYILRQGGIQYADLSSTQREQLLDLISVYTGRLRAGHAELRLEEVKRHLSELSFGWSGECDDTNPFYYRIYSPVVLIEFDHLPGIVYDNKEPSRRHIHTMVRTPNGNDYGRDLLRQHYQLHDHSHADTPHRQGHG